MGYLLTLSGHTLGLLLIVLFVAYVAEGEALEIKCPCCHRGEEIHFAAANDKKFCLKKLMVNCNWTLTIYTITRYKPSCLYAVLSIVIFVYAHLLMVSQLCILSVLTETINSGQTVWK